MLLTTGCMGRQDGGVLGTKGRRRDMTNRFQAVTNSLKTLSAFWLSVHKEKDKLYQFLPNSVPKIIGGNGVISLNFTPFSLIPVNSQEKFSSDST